MFFFFRFPQRKNEKNCLPSPPVFSQQRMGGLGLQTIQAALGARFHAKPVVPGREVIASQWKAKTCMLWKSMETMGEETYQDDFD